MTIDDYLKPLENVKPSNMTILLDVHEKSQEIKDLLRHLDTKQIQQALIKLEELNYWVYSAIAELEDMRKLPPIDLRNE